MSSGRAYDAPSQAAKAWTSAGQRLPELTPVEWEGMTYYESTTVLGYGMDGYAVVKLTRDGREAPGLWVDIDGNVWPVGYWMPLPEPPKGK